MTIILSESWELYFEVAVLFFAGYHIAYLFKNFSRLLQAQGLVSVLTVAWMISVVSVVLNNVEQLQSWYYTAGYALGFVFRFFRDDY